MKTKETLSSQPSQSSRQNQQNDFRTLRATGDRNFLLCSHQYAQKITDTTRATTRVSTPGPSSERARTLLLLTRVPSLVSLKNINDTDMSSSNARATSWNPQHSRITRENKDYMTALAKGLSRDDTKQMPNENGEIFSSRWHHNLPNNNNINNNANRPGTAKSLPKGGRPPTSAPDRLKLSLSTLIEVNRPTTAPVIIEERPRRLNTAKIKSAAPTRPPPPPPPPAPLRAPRLIDASGNFDNLTNSAFLNLTDGIKSSIYKSDNHFVHQICTHTNDISTEQLNTSRDSFLDVSNVTITGENINEKGQMNDTVESDQDEHKVDSPPQICNAGSWYRDAKSGRIEAIANIPSRKTITEDPKEIERRIVQQENEAMAQRQKEIDEYLFDLPCDTSVKEYEFKSPFTEEYDQAILLQAQLPTTNANGEWNIKDFYRDVKTKFEDGTNTKAVFEKSIKLARLQAGTIKWEQRRRQNLLSYNRLVKSAAVDVSTSNLSGNFSTKTNNLNEKEIRELNELKRDLRCNECKRVTCLGNCAAGQDYHLYKRIVSTIASQITASRQPLVPNASSARDHHRCKQGCTTCSTSNFRASADFINSNSAIPNPTTTNHTTATNNHHHHQNNSSNTTNNAAASVSTNNNNINRLRSCKPTYSYAQKSQRPAIDLRPRSMHQVTKEMKLKFEQANLSPVVVVPLFEDESQSILTRRSQKRSPNGLLPGKSFRSQRRDSLTMLAPQKVLS